MSRIRADRYTNRAGTGAPTFADGVNVVGITSINPGAGTTSMLVTGDLSVISGTIKGASELSISGITSSISDTAVDVFVYDTSKDSDGGAWRKRTQNTSWYNETLNTATRGSREEFPAVAVIVAESNPNKVTIYDGDDPDLPMWMVFSTSTGSDITNTNFLAVAGQTLSSVAMLNGDLCIGFPSGNGWGISRVNFVSDSQFWYWTSANLYAQVKNTVAERNAQNGYYNTNSGISGLCGASVKDIAMTVLPNAPVDIATELPVPTVASASNGGVSVIKDDGSVFDLTYTVGTVASELVEFDGTGGIFWGGYSPFGNGQSIYLYWNKTLPIADDSSAPDARYASNANAAFDLSTKSGNFGYNSLSISDIIAAGASNGLFLIDQKEDSPANGMTLEMTSSYNTGWMHGDIKGAFLSDTDTTNVTGTELVTNGTFASNTTGWGAGNGATLTQQSNGNPGGNVNVLSGASSNGYASQTNTAVIGKYYTLSFDHYHVNGSQGYVNIGTSIGGSQYVYQQLGTSSSWTTYSFTIKATSTDLFTGFYSRPNGNVRYDNISLRESDPDRSVNNKGLQVYGTITKSAVATGADLVAYSGFSNSDYLQQPVNSDMQTGTGGFSVTAWFKTTSTATEYEGLIYYNRPGSIGEGFQIMMNNSDKGLYWYVYGPTNDSNTTEITGLNDGNWHQLVATHTDGRQQLFIDGVLKNTQLIVTGSMNDAQAQLHIGRWYGNADVSNYWWRGSAALVRHSASIPSAEQVKKIYEDEKVLFQENAKATLYGSSDTVTALAYDDTIELLHVGTSAGRSEFQGLRRINNTTTAVTTAISASNELVAEQ